MTKTEEVTLLDREGVDQIIKRMQDLDENPQQVQNFLTLTCLMAQSEMIEYESFIQLVSMTWPIAGKIIYNK